MVVNNRYALEEGAAIKAIREEIGKVIDLGPEGVHYAANTAKVEKQMQMTLNFLNERIEYYDYILKRNTKAQKVLTGRVDDLIAEGVITRERIINYVIENMKPEEVRLVEVLKQAKAGGMTRLQMASELRKYLTAIGSKRAKSPILGLMRKASYKTLKSNLTPKTQKFIKDYPELLEEGNTAIPSRIAKKGLRVGPVAVIGALLTAALITEIKSDNHFGVETVSNRQLVNLQRSIDNGTAGDADIVMFYSNPQIDSLTNKDTKHFIKSFNLLMDLEEAEKNFDVIDNILSDEALAANYDINANEKVQNELDAQLVNISEKVAQYENML